MEGKNPLFEIGAAIGLMKKVNPAEAWREIDEREVRELAKVVKHSPEAINDMATIVSRGAEIVLGQEVTATMSQSPQVEMNNQYAQPVNQYDQSNYGKKAA